MTNLAKYRVFYMLTMLSFLDFSDKFETFTVQVFYLSECVNSLNNPEIVYFNNGDQIGSILLSSSTINFTEKLNFNHKDQDSH